MDCEDRVGGAEGAFLVKIVELEVNLNASAECSSTDVPDVTAVSPAGPPTGSDGVSDLTS